MKEQEKNVTINNFNPNLIFEFLKTASNNLFVGLDWPLKEPRKTKFGYHDFTKSKLVNKKVEVNYNCEKSRITYTFGTDFDIGKYIEKIVIDAYKEDIRSRFWRCNDDEIPKSLKFMTYVEVYIREEFYDESPNTTPYKVIFKYDEYNRLFLEGYLFSGSPVEIWAEYMYTRIDNLVDVTHCTIYKESKGTRDAEMRISVVDYEQNGHSYQTIYAWDYYTCDDAIPMITRDLSVDKIVSTHLSPYFNIRDIEGYKSIHETSSLTLKELKRIFFKCVKDVYIEADPEVVCKKAENHISQILLLNHMVQQYCDFIGRMPFEDMIEFLESNGCDVLHNDDTIVFQKFSSKRRSYIPLCTFLRKLYKTTTQIMRGYAKYNDINGEFRLERIVVLPIIPGAVQDEAFKNTDFSIDQEVFFIPPCSITFRYNEFYTSHNVANISSIRILNNHYNDYLKECESVIEFIHDDGTEDQYDRIRLYSDPEDQILRKIGKGLDRPLEDIYREEPIKFKPVPLLTSEVYTQWFAGPPICSIDKTVEKVLKKRHKHFYYSFLEDDNASNYSDNQEYEYFVSADDYLELKRRHGGIT